MLLVTQKVQLDSKLVARDEDVLEIVMMRHILPAFLQHGDNGCLMDTVLEIKMTTKRRYNTCLLRQSLRLEKVQE